MVVAACAFCQAWLFDLGGPRPNYFSGTNPQVWGAVHLLPKPDDFEGFLSLSSVTVKIGGEVVHWWTLPQPYPEDPVAGEHFRVRFDSAKFSPGAPLLVTVEGFDTAGRYYYAMESIVVKNKATIYGRADLEAVDLQDQWLSWSSGQWHIGSPAWRSTHYPLFSSAASNYSVVHNYSRGWSAEDFLADIEGSNIIYVASHGSAYSFTSDKDDFNYYYPGVFDPLPPHETQRIYGAGVYNPPNFAVFPVRYVQIGGGSPLPPFNSTANPPTNLSFLLACSTGNAWDFRLGFLWPYQWAFSLVEHDNMAHVGFNFLVPLHMYSAIADAVFTSLESGETIYDACQSAFDAYKLVYDDLLEFEDFMTIYGDVHMRMRSVYTGDMRVQSLDDWFMLLN